jgi:hypothetical protein
MHKIPQIHPWVLIYTNCEADDIDLRDGDGDYGDDDEDLGGDTLSILRESWL